MLTFMLVAALTPALPVQEDPRQDSGTVHASAKGIEVDSDVTSNLKAAGDQRDAQAEVQEGCCALFPAPAKEMVIEIGPDKARPSLATVVSAYGLATNQHIVFNDETRAMLEAQTVGIDETLSVPGGEFQSVFEHLLAEYDFTLAILRKGAPRLLAIHSLRTQARNTIRSKAINVPVDLVEHLEQHPALLVTTVLNLPHIDVRQLSNSVRTMVTDANTQQIIPAGNSNSLIIMGFGNQVAELATQFNLMEAVAKASFSQRVEPVFELIALKHAAAPEVQLVLQRLLGGARSHPGAQGAEGPAVPNGRDTTPNIQVDQRTNSLLILALPDAQALIRQVVTALDTEQ